MPVVKPVEQDLKQVYLPSTDYQRNDQGEPVLDADGNKIPEAEENRAWMVLDISPSMGRDLVMIESDDNQGSVILKDVVNRLKEWNFLKEDGERWPINKQTVCEL